MVTLFQDQQEALADVQASFAKGNRAVLLQAACGFGKTQVASKIAQMARSKGRAVTISAPRVQLTSQIENTLSDNGVEGVFVETKQTLVLNDIPGDLVIDDEAHYACSDAWAERCRAVLNRGGWILGLSASPIPGMDKIYQDMVCGPPVEWLMENKRLSKYRAFGPARPDMSGVKTTVTDYGRDYSKSGSEDVMDKPSVTGDAAEAWFKYAKGLRTIGYCISRKHAQSVAQNLRDHGIRAAHIDGMMGREERNRLINMFADREVEWLASVNLVTLGFDMASQVGRDVTIEAMHDLDPTKALPKHIQKCGRPLRMKDTPAIFIDSAGNLERNGFPDDDFEWSIASGTRRKSNSAMAVSICSSCFGAFRTAPQCPYCETVRELTPREIEEREGELRELERDKAKKVARVQVGMAGTDIEKLAAIAVEREYSTGWIAQRLKIKGQHVDWPKIHKAVQIAKAAKLYGMVAR